MFLRNKHRPEDVRFYDQILDEESRKRHHALVDEFINRHIYWRSLSSGPFHKYGECVTDYYGQTGPLYRFIFILGLDGAEEYERRMKEKDDGMQPT